MRIEMAEKVAAAPALLRTITKLQHSSTPAGRAKRNRNRNLRRKRSRLNYKRRLRRCRTDRFSIQLCDRFASAADLFNMDLSEAATATNVTHPQYECSIPEVADWQHQHQIAYWKSRAVSLEYENRMLHQHIRNMYEHQIDERIPRETSATSLKKRCQVKREPEEPADVELSNKTRQKQVKELYGVTAAKIMGMETAVQVNYDFHKERHQPHYWPNLPLKL